MYCSCRKVDMKQVPKALTVNETKGLIKMVIDPKKDNRIVGVHISRYSRRYHSRICYGCKI